MAWPPHITVAAIAERNGKFLFVEENIDGRVVLNQPAGHLDPGETLFEAVRREVMEETGWRVEPLSIAGIYHYFSPEAQTTYHRMAFVVEPIQQTDHPLDPVIRRILWLAPEALARHRLRSPMVRQCIEDYRHRGGIPLDFLTHIDAAVSR